MSHARERIVWHPTWGKEFEGWSAHFINENLWRCDQVLDFDDLLQEAFITFVKIADTYPRVIEPKNFMALFKRAMINKMHDRSAYKRRKDCTEVKVSLDVSEFFVGRIGEVTNGGYLATLLNEVPEEMKLALMMLVNNNSEKPHRRKHRLEERENLSRQICRILGLPLNCDPVADIKQLLST